MVPPSTAWRLVAICRVRQADARACRNGALRGKAPLSDARTQRPRDFAVHPSARCRTPASLGSRGGAALPLPAPPREGVCGRRAADAACDSAAGRSRPTARAAASLRATSRSASSTARRPRSAPRAAFEAKRSFKSSGAAVACLTDRRAFKREAACETRPAGTRGIRAVLQREKSSKRAARENLLSTSLAIPASRCSTDCVAEATNAGLSARLPLPPYDNRHIKTIAV